MSYIKLDSNGVVTGKSAYPDIGLIEAPDWVVCGMVKSGATYIVPAKPLAEAKAEKLTSLESSRDATTIGNVTAHTRQWQADERSQKLLSSAITLAMAGAPLPPVWRDAANNNMAITVIGELVAIAGAMAVQTQNAYTKSWKLKSDVAAALTPEAVALVVW